jgi:hypothetical protein
MLIKSYHVQGVSTRKVKAITEERVVTGTWLWSNESRKAWLVFRPRSPPANSETLPSESAE